MRKFELYLNPIHQYFPELNVFSIKKIGEGDNSKAFQINDYYIFRFPKRQEAKDQLKKEVAILPKIKKYISLDIPEFKFVSSKTNFAGHLKIPGEPLTFKIYHSLEKKQQVFIQQSLSTFLTQLHKIPLSRLSNCGLEIMNLKEEYSDNFANTQRLIYPNISKANRKIIIKFFTDYLNDSTNFDYIPTLIHNDFSSDHILWDVATNQIGIIDFGDIAIGDPDYDLMYLLEFDEDVLQAILKYYKPSKKNIMNKLFFFALGNKLQILIASIQKNDLSDIKDSYKELNSWFKKYNKRKEVSNLS